MVKKCVWIYIEGGSTGKAGDADFRKGWKTFLHEVRELAQENGYHSLEVVRGRGRASTFKSFRGSPHLHPGDLCVLLVDSEDQFEGEVDVWDFVASRTGDQWQRPDWATSDHLYLMKATTETWLLTDQEALKQFFGRDFNTSVLPTTELEEREKHDVEAALVKASKPCKRKSYRHGDAHVIIGLVRPERVKTLSHGKRLFDGLSVLIKP